jgi:hypothetical protein
VETNRLVTEIRMHRRLRSYDNYFMKLSSGLKLHSP